MDSQNTTGRNFLMSEEDNAARHRAKQNAGRKKKSSPHVISSLGEIKPRLIKPKLKAPKKRNKAKKLVRKFVFIEPPLYVPGMRSRFYLTVEWRKLRHEVITDRKNETAGGLVSCVLCGRSRGLHGIVIHVDHIKPRSKFPELELTRSNLQILCEDCNVGKSDTYQD